MTLPPISGEALAAVSRELVRMKAQHYGKGPMETKTYANDNFLFCVMKGGLTRVEETLVAGGEAALVRTVRPRFQEQVREMFVSSVEEIVGRKVLAYESQILFDPDTIVEIFLLADDKARRRSRLSRAPASPGTSSRRSHPLPCRSAPR